MTVNINNGTKDTDPVLPQARMIGINLMVGDVDRSAAFYSELLGAPPISDGQSSRALDVGQCVLWLKPRVGLAPTARDGTAIMTFMVPDISEATAALRSRGVEVGEIFRYEVGATADFYDPDGHSLALYEPSTTAMSWPSGEKLTSVANGRVAPTLVYIFLFVPDAEAAYSFYHDELGLFHLECRPCRRGSIDHEQGVVKYDVGSLMLTTHLARGADDSETGQAVRDPRFLSELVPIFVADDLDAVMASLKQRGIAASMKGGPPQAREVSFTDRFGRPFLVRETCSALRRSPEGAQSGSVLSTVSR
jgi:catechol 2,3-dioxygenase-like lactoylglutathione lyase family enzyme